MRAEENESVANLPLSTPFKLIFHLILATFAVFCILPLILLISISFSKESDILKFGFSLIPKTFTLDAYQYVWNDIGSIVGAYKITLFVVIIGTILCLWTQSMLAYTLSRREFAFNRLFTFIVFFTMLFSGGLVPGYILITRYLHLVDNIWVLILPMLPNAWSIMIMRTFFKSLPYSLIESAKIDGASEIRVYAQILLPLSTPVLATMGLQVAIGYWNDWWLGLLYINSDNLLPVQLFLKRLLDSVEFIKSAAISGQISTGGLGEYLQMPTESLRMAAALVTILPILMVYPFLQRFFAKGMTVGSVKG